MSDTPLVATLYGVSGVLVLATFAWPAMAPRPDQARARGVAEAALARIAEGERAALTGGGRYVPFGPTEAERKAALPGLDLGPEADKLSFDAVLDREGVLHLRAVSRPEAVRAGRIAPVLSSMELKDGPKDAPKKGI